MRAITVQGSSKMDTLKGWLSACEAECHGCVGDSHDESFPQNMRLLQLENDVLKLTTRSSGKPERYACLSHCWGSADHLNKSRAKNYGTFMSEGIAIDLLPKTYFEAVQVCKYLGIHHLWIDSLCIIQVDLDDWNEHASRMEAIYEHSVLPIASVNAENASEGLFTKMHEAHIGRTLPKFPSIHFSQEVRVPDRRAHHFKTNQGEG